MTPFKKIKVLTQAELDAIELAGTQEEGVDYRVKGEINYYKHEVVITTTGGNLYKYEVLTSDDTEITTFAGLYSLASNVSNIGYCENATYGKGAFVNKGLSSTTFDTIDICESTTTGVASYTLNSYTVATDISSITDTVIEL